MRNNRYNTMPGSQFKKAFKSNDKLLNLIRIHKMHSEFRCSETEDVQTSIITAMTDMFDNI